MIIQVYSIYVQLHMNILKIQTFRADSENNTPLLPTMPTVCPNREANPVIKEVPYFFLNSKNFEPSTNLAIT